MDMILMTLEVAEQQPDVTGQLPGGAGYPTTAVPEDFLERVDLLALACWRMAGLTGKPAADSFAPVVDFFVKHGYHRGPVAARIAEMMEVHDEEVEATKRTFREAFADAAA